MTQHIIPQLLLKTRSYSITLTLLLPFGNVLVFVTASLFYHYLERLDTEAHWGHSFLTDL